MKEINICVANVQVPHEFSRKFPEIKPKHTKYKATEMKIFLFYLSVPILNGIMPIDNWCFLFIYVFATRTLYEPNLTKKDIDLAGLYNWYNGL